MSNGLPVSDRTAGDPEPAPAGRGRLRVLILEDGPADAELEQRLLRGAGVARTEFNSQLGVMPGYAAFIREETARKAQHAIEGHMSPAPCLWPVTAGRGQRHRSSPGRPAGAPGGAHDRIPPRGPAGVSA